MENPELGGSYAEVQGISSKDLNSLASFLWLVSQPTEEQAFLRPVPRARGWTETTPSRQTSPHSVL